MSNANELNNVNPEELQQTIHSQQEKINFLVGIITEWTSTGNTKDISDEKLKYLTNLNVKEAFPNTGFLNLNKPKKRNSFLSMIATQLNKTSSFLSFKKENDFSWENLGFKLGVKVKNLNDKISKSNVAYQQLKENLGNKASQAGVTLKESKFYTKTQGIFETIVLIGTKKDIYQMNKKFKQELSILGFEAEDLFLNIDKPYASKNEVEIKIQEKLKNKLQFTEEDGHYRFDILETMTTGESKVNMIQKVLWPALQKELSQTLELAFTIQDVVHNKNKEIQLLNNFSKQNDMHTDTVIHSLIHHPELLSDYPGFNKLMKEKDNILKSSEKYDTIISNNTIISQQLLKGISALKFELEKINTPESLNFIEQINQHVIASKKSKTANSETIFTIPILEHNLIAVDKVERKNEKLPEMV